MVAFVLPQYFVSVMVVRRHLWLVIVLALVAVPRPYGAAASIAYRFTIPEPQHHWMQV